MFGLFRDEGYLIVNTVLFPVNLTSEAARKGSFDTNIPHLMVYCFLTDPTP